MFDCRYCECRNFRTEQERDDHEFSCLEKELFEADCRIDEEEREKQSYTIIMDGCNT